MKKSVWSDSVKLPEFEKLEGDRKTDCLIIGGGIAGILTAYFLDASGVDYILVEGSKIASGTTRNTTAKITSLHGLIYDKLLRDFGKEYAQSYLLANQSALLKYEELSKRIECDFEKKDAYTYSLTSRSIIEDEVNAANRLGFEAEFTEDTELPFAVKGAVKFKNQAQFNPLKFIAEISKGLNIYENSFVREITPTEVITDTARIKPGKIIVATHFPFINRHGNFFLKLYQHRSYVTAFKNVPSLQGMYVDEDKKGMSLRSYGDYLFIGGGGHRTGKKSDAWQGIDDFSAKYYPEAIKCYSWAAQDCMSLDSIPYIGRYSKNTPDMFVATGFNKWGMTSSMVAANILADMVQGKKNDFAEYFSPQRSILKPQLLVNGFESTLNLLTPTKKRCPHLGCALKWNSREHSWDCPCHGSRFEENGKLIDNPATDDAKITD